MQKLSFLTLSALICATICLGSGKDSSKWYRGNTHTHTNFSDGTTPINDVVKWYDDYGYDFLLITDHNITSDPQAVKATDLVIVHSNEVTEKHVHMTAMNVSSPITPAGLRTDHDTNGKYNQGISGDMESTENKIKLFSNGISEAGGVVIMNHPNFIKGVQSEEMYPAEKLTHIEVFNGHPQCYNWGNDLHKSVGDKWDDLLSRGKLVYGVASDDAHNFRKMGVKHASPGRGWIMVDAKALTPKQITKAVAEGKFYASSGVFLDQCTQSKGRVAVKVNRDKSIAEFAKGNLFPNITESGQEGFTIQTIGENGKILKSATGLELSYKLQKNDKYARIMVTYCVKSGDKYHSFYAWTQPVM